MNAPDAPRGVTPGLFRTLMGRFASGVTVVTTMDERQRPHGMTVSAFSSLSLDPPLVLVCVDRAASMLGVLEASHHFAVNILADRQEALSRRFSDEAMELRFEGVDHRPGVSGAPVIESAHAVIECRRHSRYDVGDHCIFVGEVVAGHVAAEGGPLVFHRGAYGRFGPAA